MITRSLKTLITDSLTNFPVVGLIGPRQCGKTTLAKEIGQKNDSVLYLDLELPSDLAKLNEAEFFLSQFPNHLIILDEVHRKPDLFPLIRSLVDADRRNGRFLILGSASPDLKRQSSESLAGRIIYHELTPFLIEEVGADEDAVKNLWNRGGYPLSSLAATNQASVAWRQAFMSTYLERDIPQLGIRVPGSTLRRFWQMIGHYHAQQWNASSIAGSLGVSPVTARHYLDILNETFMVRQLKPWHANQGKRLVKSPKIFIRDSGILHALQNIQDYSSLIAHPLAGASFEGFVIEQIASIIPSVWELFFYRTFSGAEIDLLIVPSGSSPVAVEIKLSFNPVLGRGYHEAFKDISCRKGFIVYPGKEQYDISKGTTVLPVKNIGDIVGLIAGSKR